MVTFTERDPAERSAFNRLFYRDRRPHRTVSRREEVRS